MNDQTAAVHRTFLVVDIESFGDRRRTNHNQLAIREGLYLVVREAFRYAEIPWIDQYHEDRGDGLFVLVVPEVPKSVFVELLPYLLLNALTLYNRSHEEAEQIRLRMALHAGEVNFDEHGATSSSLNFTFRLIASESLKKSLAQSASPLALVTSEWFFDEVVRHSAAPASLYRPVQIEVKETKATGWVYFPKDKDRVTDGIRDHATARAAPQERPTREHERARDCRETLASLYKSALTESITLAEAIPMGLEMPTLTDGYIDHRIRVTEFTSSADPGRESWWIDAPVYDSSKLLLRELLSSNTALKFPIILLGHPGSGKSILSRILAGSLPTNDFMPVHIELRKVPMQSDLQQTIEYAVRATTGESIPWPQLVDTVRKVRPVVILDGFDELLQTTGVTHNNFLTDVQSFQKREHVAGRPLAVIVTSRTAVIDRAQIPYGATVVKLEPFDDDQVRNWLGTWAQSNRVAFINRALTPLPAEIALSYNELAEQPLLLLMLALYDAHKNELQHRSAELGRTELYASLLRDFAGREVSRQSDNLSPVAFKREVEHELLRLSIAAFSMFNRRSQWVHETDLDSDLALLLNEDTTWFASPAKSTRLTPAQLTFGRFFFVHEAQTIDDGGDESRTYEFLHSTFGEFLVAQLVARILSQMTSASNRPIVLQPEGMGSEKALRTLLSFSALTARSPIIPFVNDLLGQLSKQRRTVATELLLRLHSRALFSGDWNIYSDYEPIELRATERYAAWSVNLVILAITVGEGITSSQLYPDAEDAVNEWRKEVMIWRSQLSGYGWEELHEVIALERAWDEHGRGIRLRLNNGTYDVGYPDIFWMYNMPVNNPSDNESFVDRRHNSDIMLRKINFICNMSEDILTHGLEPVISLFPAVANVFVVIDNRTVSAAHVFIAALYATYGDSARREAAFLDLARVAVKLVEVPDTDHDASYLSAALVVVISAVEKGLATSKALVPFARVREDFISRDSSLIPLLARLDDLLPSYELDTRASRDSTD